MRAVVVSLVLWVGVGADAAVLCTARSGSGTVRVRATCRPHETQLDPVELGLQGPAGPATPGLMMRDANGVLIGTILDANDATDPERFRLLLKVEGTLVTAYAETSGFVSTGGNAFAYESADCSGQPFYATERTSVPVVPGDVRGGTLTFQKEPVTTHSFGSALNFLTSAECSSSEGSFTPPNRCCFTTPWTGTGSSFGTLDLSLFTPPFHAEAP